MAVLLMLGVRFLLFTGLLLSKSNKPNNCEKFENIWSVFFCVWTLVHSLGLKLGLDPPSDPEDVEVNPSEWNLKCVQHTSIEIHQTRVFKDMLKTFASRITEKLFAFSGGSQQWQQTHCEVAKRAGSLWIWDILSYISRFCIILEAFWQHKLKSLNMKLFTLVLFFHVAPFPQSVCSFVCLISFDLSWKKKIARRRRAATGGRSRRWRWRSATRATATQSAGSTLSPPSFVSHSCDREKEPTQFP